MNEEIHVGDVPVPEQEYVWIRKWSKVFSTPDYITENSLKVARRDGAPQNSIYKAEHGAWVTTDDITSLTMRRQLGLPLA